MIGKKASDSHIGGGCLAVSRTGVGISGVRFKVSKKNHIMAQKNSCFQDE